MKKISHTVFIKDLMDREAPVTVYLSNGIKLQGNITNYFFYEDESLAYLNLTRDDHTMVVFGGQIATLSEDKPKNNEAAPKGLAGHYE